MGLWARRGLRADTGEPRRAVLAVDEDLEAVEPAARLALPLRGRRHLGGGHRAGGRRLLAQGCEGERRRPGRLQLPKVTAAEQCSHGASVDEALPATRGAAQLPDAERRLLARDAAAMRHHEHE